MKSPTIVDQIIDCLEDELLAGERFEPLCPESVEFLRGRSRTHVPAPSPVAAEPAAQQSPPMEEARPAPSSGSRERRADPAPYQPAPPAPPEQPEQPAVDVSGMDLETLADTVRHCYRCPLARERTQTVFGEGPPDAELMFIGEGPGFEEDRQGRPFVGPAGQLLTDIIHAMQFSREDVYIANIVKCRPPGNRTPDPAEMDACIPYLYRQIELIGPKVIVLLGATPLSGLLGKRGITRLRGQWLDYRGIPVMPTFHPSYLLRKPEAKREVWEDMQQVMSRFGKDPGQSRKRH